MKTIICIVVVLALFGIFFVRTYTSSPGHTTAEYAAEWAKTAPKCYGYSYLTNAEAMAADAPGKSICFGYLKTVN